jgi:uncharacterized FAD-dependent dehydrogenase
MKKVSLVLNPQEAANEESLKSRVLRKANMPSGQFIIERKSIDARRAPVKIRIDALVDEAIDVRDTIEYRPSENNVVNKDVVIIIGAGPAGLFAAIELIALGYKPVIFERGKDVQARRRDLAKINREGIVDEDSNYCFGEGGAGTYSDGKLYTRSKKRGSVRKVLEILHYHGARENILYEAHPHIGTNKLPRIIASMREYIIEHGGEIHFDARVDDILIKDGQAIGVKIKENEIKGIAVVLATGHSARDIYELLERKKILIEAKSFAIGVRVEHPQELIDSIQYHSKGRNEYLPAAAYSLVCQVDYEQVKKGVFSFCMCPGGFIVPAATGPGEIVVNGMSPSRRNSKFANSGIVVAIDDHEVGKLYGDSPLRYMQYQAAIEQAAFASGGASLAAPAQRLSDFVNGRQSSTLPETSYKPGIKSVNMGEVLPAAINERLRFAFRDYNRKMKGFLTNDAVILGVESRTSAPVRIPRNRETLEHVVIAGLYPAGEGAGYAGGIVSAAIDGENIARVLVEKYEMNFKR